MCTKKVHTQQCRCNCCSEYSNSSVGWTHREVSGKGSGQEAGRQIRNIFFSSPEVWRWCEEPGAPSACFHLLLVHQCSLLPPLTCMPVVTKAFQTPVSLYCLPLSFVPPGEWRKETSVSTSSLPTVHSLASADHTLASIADEPAVLSCNPACQPFPFLTLGNTWPSITQPFLVKNESAWDPLPSWVYTHWRLLF